MKKIICTIGITIAFVTAVIAAKNLYSYKVPIHNRGIGALLSSQETETLFLGSSAFRSNLDITQLDEAYDGKTYILAYGGNQYVAEEIEYDEIKKRGGHVCDLLVIELNPMILTEEVKLSDSRIPFDLSWSGKRRLWKAMADRGEVNLSMYYEYFVTSGLDDLITYPFTEPFYATRYEKGAKTDETMSPGREVLDAASFDISGIRIEEAQVNALFSLIDKCERDSQNYVLLECPHYYRLQEDPAFQRVHSDITSQLDAKGVPCIPAYAAFDDHEAAYFEDMNHMSEEGRKVFTKQLIPLLETYSSR